MPTDTAPDRSTSGYMPCSCRDCFEGPIIGVAGDMCDDCVKAGCSGDGECLSPYAYGGGGDDGGGSVEELTGRECHHLDHASARDDGRR